MRRNRIIHFLAVIMVFLYACSLGLSAIANAIGAPKPSQSLVAKKEKPASKSDKSDTQFPYEEKEIEADDEVQNDGSLFYLCSEPILFLEIPRDQTCFNSIPRAIDGHLNLPIYLVNQAMLI